MADKGLAFATINIGNVMSENARRSFQAAARRWQADYLELTDDNAPPIRPAHLLKLELFRLTNARRIFFLDGSDALIRSDAPSPFARCPENRLGVTLDCVKRSPSCADAVDQVEIEWHVINERLGRAQPVSPFYFNAGMMVLSRAAHAPMMDRARDLYERLNGILLVVQWVDQTIINYAAAELGLPVQPMDETWNYVNPEQMGHWNHMEQYIYHFAGLGERFSVLPGLSWQAPTGKCTAGARSARARRWLFPPAETSPAGDFSPRLRRVAKRIPLAVPAMLAAWRAIKRRPNPEREELHRAALEVAKNAIYQYSLRPIQSLEQLPPMQPRCCLATQDQFMTPEFLFWCHELKETPRWHRKLWEFYYVCQVLWERGMLRPGRAGCGFGVGRDPLPALFCRYGCSVLATDAPAVYDQIQETWRRSGQHSASLNELNSRRFVSPEEFAARARFRPVDMSAIPEDLGTFDFVWSSCVAERLGGLREGIDFMVNACRLLKPGGVAVHTTEFNVTSNAKTIESGPVVLFRQRDILAMRDRVESQGCCMAPIDLSPGDGPFDRYADRPPYGTPHLKLALGRYVTTSLALVVERPK